MIISSRSRRVTRRITKCLPSPCVFDDVDDFPAAVDVDREFASDASLARQLEDALTNGSHLQPATLLQYQASLQQFASVLVTLHGPLRGMRSPGIVELARYSLPELCAAASARMLDICLASVQHKPDSQRERESPRAA